MLRLSMRVVLVVPFWLVACSSTQTVSFQTDGKGSVAVVDWENLGAEGERIGDTPVSVELSKVNGKVLRISQEKKLPQYWVVACDERRTRLTAKLRLPDAPAPTDCAAQIAAAKKEVEAQPQQQAPQQAQAAPAVPSVPVAALNKTHRLLLKAYEALISDDLPLARDLAQQLATQVPELASPFIIIGLTHLRAGDQENARLSFTKAASLDPEDDATKELMQMTQF